MFFEKSHVLIFLGRMIKNSPEWRSLVRMLGDKRVPKWNNEGDGIKCKQCEREFETTRGLICHLAKTLKKRETL